MAWRIQPEPFTLSLLALERLATDLSIGKVDRSIRCFSDIKFKVGLSFPGEHRVTSSRSLTLFDPRSVRIACFTITTIKRN